MSEDFVHLHVASCYSLQYGTSTPVDLIERAAAHGQRALALTDRDGLYGAVRFVRACVRAGVAPVLGVDLAVDTSAPFAVPDGPFAAATGPHHTPEGRAARPRDVTNRPGRQIPPAPAPVARTPARGGALVDARLPRVTVLARGRGARVPPGLGWERLCRLVTDTHLRGERSHPVSTPQLIAARARSGVPGTPSALLVLLGPDSDVGRAALAGRRSLARRLLDAWTRVLPPDALAIEVVDHGGPPGSPHSAGQAARLTSLAAHAGLRVVITGAVRHVDPEQAVVVDVLDAARRLVMLDERHLDRVSTAGHLAPAKTMYAAALRITGERVAARRLLDTSVDLALECIQDARDDIGIGGVHLPEVEALGLAPDDDAHGVLARRCHDAVPARYPGARTAELDQVRARLDDELAIIAALGYPTYFLTVAQVCDIVRDMGVRVAARGSGAGSLVNHLLGISGIDPIRHGLLMERFCTPLRAQLPDIDLDVEAARRTHVYEAILERYTGERVTCVSMMETYRVRHAIRDVGSVLGLPRAEIDAIAKAFPHIAARDVRAALEELPELARLGLDSTRLHVLFDLVEHLDSLPRHVALHPCGIVLSNRGLLGRTPVEASAAGFPMSQFDKDDVEALGLLKLDVLGIRMQSAMAHAVAEIERVEAERIDLDDRTQVPLDDPDTYALISSAQTLGCFQIESPGQRELVGKFGPETFDDIIIDISLFRPGPVKSDMIAPFLAARQGWAEPDLLHPSLESVLAQTHGVVVFHEQVLHIVAATSGISLAEADEVRRALGTHEGRDEVEAWWRPLAAARGYAPADVERIWEVLAAFASFGFCKAHAAAFALPTYQSAWLKTHHRAAFLAGVLTHDPGMYPKRLILDDARVGGVVVLGLDVNRSDGTYRLERVGSDPARHGIRLSLSDVLGICDAEVASIVAGQPYAGLPDFLRRAHVSRPVTERLVLAGAFDELYGIDDAGGGLGRRGGVGRRDLLLQVAELDRWGAGAARRGTTSRRVTPRRGRTGGGRTDARAALSSYDETVTGPHDAHRPGAVSTHHGQGVDGADVRRAVARQSRTPVGATAHAAQLTFDLVGDAELTRPVGLPEMTRDERVHAELEVLGLDVSGHVLDPYADLLAALDVVRAADLRSVRSRSEVLVAGVKVATQTPPVRSGRRVVFLTLDDSTGPVDATFFEDVQGPYAGTVFHSWLLLVRGIVRRTGPMGVSVRATGAWELTALHTEWEAGGVDAVAAAVAATETSTADRRKTPTPGDERTRRVYVHPSGFRQSPFTDVRPPGESGRKLWHTSAGSSGR